MKLLNRLPSALQQSALYALALAGAKGVSLLMVPVFTHYLSPADYGRLDILQTLADILSIIIGLGLADTLFRFCNDQDPEESKKTVAQLYGIAWIIALGAFILTQLAAPMITAALPGDLSVMQTRLILCSLSLSGTILVPMAWLRFQGRAAQFLAGSLGRTVFQALLAAGLLMAGFGLTGFVLGGFIACLCLCLYLAKLQLAQTGIRFELSAFKTFGPYGGPLIFAGFAGFILGSFDRWILAETLGTAEMAQYALAAKFGLITAVLIQPYDMWWHAKRFSVLAQHNGAEKCARYGSVAVCLVCGAVLFVCGAAPVLIQWLTPQSYHGSIQYVPYLVLFAGLHNLTQTLGFGIYTQQTSRLPALIDGTSAAIALLAYFIFIPPYGIMGAIFATFCALSIRFIATYLMAQRTCAIPYAWPKYLVLAGYCIAFALTIKGRTDALDLMAFSVGGLVLLVVLSTFLGLLPLRPKVHGTTKLTEGY